MRNFTILVPFLLMLSASSMAQSSSKVTGHITDNNNKPLASVTVSLLKAKDSGLVKAAVSDGAGKFELPVNNHGRYLLSYSLVGYENKFSSVFEVTEGQAVNVNSVALSPAAGKLQ